MDLSICNFVTLHSNLLDDESDVLQRQTVLAVFHHVVKQAHSQQFQHQTSGVVDLVPIIELNNVVLVQILPHEVL